MRHQPVKDEDKGWRGTDKGMSGKDECRERTTAFSSRCGREQVVDPWHWLPSVSRSCAGSFLLLLAPPPST